MYSERDSHWNNMPYEPTLFPGTQIIPTGEWICEWLAKYCVSYEEVHPHCFDKGKWALEAHKPWRPYIFSSIKQGIQPQVCVALPFIEVSKKEQWPTLFGIFLTSKQLNKQIHTKPKHRKTKQKQTQTQNQKQKKKAKTKTWSFRYFYLLRFFFFLL